MTKHLIVTFLSAISFLPGVPQRPKKAQAATRDIAGRQVPTDSIVMVTHTTTVVSGPVSIRLEVESAERVLTDGVYAWQIVLADGDTSTLFERPGVVVAWDSSGVESTDEEEVKPKTKPAPKSVKTTPPKSSKKVVEEDDEDTSEDDEDDEDEEEVKPAPKSGKTKPGKKVIEEDDEEDEDAGVKPAPAGRKFKF